MVPLKAIRERIERAGIRDVRRVHGAAQMAVAMERGQFDADAYVTLLQRQAGKNVLVNAVQQEVAARIAVISIIKVAGDATGEKQADLVEARSDAVTQSLLGWSPASGYSLFTAASSRLLDFDGQAVIWADEFETTYLIRKVP